MISFLLALYLGGVLSNYAELRMYRTASNEKLLDLALALKWPSYVYGWLKPAPKDTDA